MRRLLILALLPCLLAAEDHWIKFTSGPIEGSQSAAEYESLLRDHVKVAEAEEGLGLLALRDHRNDEARRHFAAATEAGSASARCFIEYATCSGNVQSDEWFM